MNGGIYVHVPFCSAVCPYCDFAVTTGRAPRRQAYVERLLREIELCAGEPGRFDTVYFGGGTPSLLEPPELGRILDALRAAVDLAPRARLHLEANPEDVDPQRTAAWRAAGVHTLSLGVQSFDDETLRRLGRRHDAAAARRAVEVAQAAGFPTVSVDLIYGLHGQTRRQWRRELEQAIALGPQHVSCYQLTIHEGTVFGLRRKRGQLSELGQAAQARRFAESHEILAQAGLHGYEVSNFARGAAHRSRHNRKYWRHAPYLGLGPSAHSYRGTRRWWNLRALGDWEARLDAGLRPVAGGEELSAVELASEALLFGLRTSAGLDLPAIERRLGVEIAGPSAAVIELCVERGWLRRSRRRLVPTVAGMALADGLAARFDVVTASAGTAPSGRRTGSSRGQRR